MQEEGVAREGKNDLVQSEEEKAREKQEQEERVSENIKKNIIKIMLLIHNKINTSEDIAEKLGVSRRQVLRYIDILERDGFVTEEKRKYFLTANGVSLLENLHLV